MTFSKTRPTEELQDFIFYIFLKDRQQRLNGRDFKYLSLIVRTVFFFFYFLSQRKMASTLNEMFLRVIQKQELMPFVGLLTYQQQPEKVSNQVLDRRCRSHPDLYIDATDREN